MRRFADVRVRNGLGGVNPHDGTVLRPPDDDRTFGVAVGFSNDHVAFHVADWACATGGVAVVSNDGQSLVLDDAMEVIARRLLASGFGAVAWLGAEGPGAAFVAAFGDAASTLEDVACAAWAVKALCGWDESALMVFPVTHIPTTVQGERRIHHGTWLSARGAFRGGAWSVDVWQLRRGSWSTLLDDLATRGDDATQSALLVDVDWTIAYNDALGHQAADVMLARVHACIEDEALQCDARFLRVAGDDFVVVLEGGLAEALLLGEVIQRRIATLNLPFVHPEVRTHDRVTVSLGITPVREPAELQRTLEDAVYEAKRGGRNRIVCRA